MHKITNNTASDPAAAGLPAGVEHEGNSGVHQVKKWQKAFPDYGGCNVLRRAVRTEPPVRECGECFVQPKSVCRKLAKTLPVP